MIIPPYPPPHFFLDDFKYPYQIEIKNLQKELKQSYKAKDNLQKMWLESQKDITRITKQNVEMEKDLVDLRASTNMALSTTINAYHFRIACQSMQQSRTRRRKRLTLFKRKRTKSKRKSIS